MATQLSFAFNSRPLLESNPVTRTDGWLDVSDIARGVGFTDKVRVSIALNDVLEQEKNETESEYDQRLYDCLCLAHLQMSLDHRSCATFNFTFQRKDWQTEKTSEVRLRVRAETEKESVFLGLLENF